MKDFKIFVGTIPTTQQLGAIHEWNLCTPKHIWWNLWLRIL